MVICTFILITRRRQNRLDSPNRTRKVLKMLGGKFYIYKVKQKKVIRDNFLRKVSEEEGVIAESFN
jgi:hypothetical protein